MALLAWTLGDLVVLLRSRAASGEGLWFDTESGLALVYVVDLPGGGWVPLLGGVALLSWLFNVSWMTVSYLWPQLLSGVAELVRIIRLEETGRPLFESLAGHTAPLLERVSASGRCSSSLRSSRSASVPVEAARTSSCSPG